MQASLLRKLYPDQFLECLHLDSYQILIRSTQVVVCGPCFFRDGFETENPTRLNRRVPTRGIGPELDPTLVQHMMLTVGLVPPEPGEVLRDWKRKRYTRSRPSQKLHPVTTALWKLMEVQPPLATVLVKFCNGYSEVDIAREFDIPLVKAVERLRKSVHTGQKFLRI